MSTADKVSWNGVVKSIQPRIRLIRSFDQRSHNYLGYVLEIEGEVDEAPGILKVAIGKKAHEKHLFRVGQAVSGLSVPVSDPRLETADHYTGQEFSRL